METVEVKCENCGREIFVLKEYLREKMFCTMVCMNSYEKAEKIDAIRHVFRPN